MCTANAASRSRGARTPKTHAPAGSASADEPPCMGRGAEQRHSESAPARRLLAGEVSKRPLCCAVPVTRIVRLSAVLPGAPASDSCFHAHQRAEPGAERRSGRKEIADGRPDRRPRALPYGHHGSLAHARNAARFPTSQLPSARCTSKNPPVGLRSRASFASFRQSVVGFQTDSTNNAASFSPLLAGR